MFLTTILFLRWDLGGPVQSLRQQPWREQRVSLFFVVKMMLGAQGTLCSRSDLECPTINLPFTTINPIPSHPLLSTTTINLPFPSPDLPRLSWPVVLAPARKQICNGDRSLGWIPKALNGQKGEVICQPGFLRRSWCGTCRCDNWPWLECDVQRTKPCEWWCAVIPVRKIAGIAQIREAHRSMNPGLPGIGSALNGAK